MDIECGQPFDDRADLYKLSGDIVAAIARRHHGIDVDAITLERWRELMGLMREVDTWADDTDASREEVMRELEVFELFARRYPHLAPGSLEDDARATIARRADHILRVGELAAREQSVQRFLALRLIEANETVNVFEDVATDYVVEQPLFRKECIPTLRALGGAATMWDSLIDARQDVKDSKQSLQPSWEYYTRLAGAMASRAKLGGKALLHAEPIQHLIRKAGRRVVNRIMYGVQPYSTLHRFIKRGGY